MISFFTAQILQYITLLESTEEAICNKKILEFVIKQSYPLIVCDKNNWDLSLAVMASLTAKKVRMYKTFYCAKMY